MMTPKVSYAMYEPLILKNIAIINTILPLVFRLSHRHFMTFNHHFIHKIALHNIFKQAKQRQLAFLHSNTWSFNPHFYALN